MCSGRGCQIRRAVARSGTQQSYSATTSLSLFLSFTLPCACSPSVGRLVCDRSAWLTWRAANHTLATPCALKSHISRQARLRSLGLVRSTLYSYANLYQRERKKGYKFAVDIPKATMYNKTVAKGNTPFIHSAFSPCVLPLVAVRSPLCYHKGS